MSSLLTLLWKGFNALPENALKMRLRFFLAFNPLVPTFVSRLSPIRASIYRCAPSRGDIVADGGAFPGDFAIHASRCVGPEGKVLAFEPNPVNFEALKRLASAFGCTNITFIQKGLWNADTSMQMSGSGVDTTVGAGGEHTVQLCALDRELERLRIPRIDFVKMDIEGAEVEALKGARETLRRCKAKLAIAAYHAFEGRATRTDIEDALASFGYRTLTDYPARENVYGWKE